MIQDLIKRAKNVGRITSLKLCRSNLLVQEEKSRRARNNELGSLPPQPEVIREQQRGGTNKETNQSQGLGSTTKADTGPQKVTLLSKSPSPEISSNDPKLPEKPKNTAYYCNVCLTNTARFSLDVRPCPTYQLLFTNSLNL